jgi:hypothetical protein
LRSTYYIYRYGTTDHNGFLAGKKVDRLDIGRTKHRARRFKKTLTSDIDFFLKLVNSL